MPQTQTRPPRTSGPSPAPGRVRVTVYLDEALAEWGKQQEGGLSDLLRRLLGEAQQEQTLAPDRYPPELRAQYRQLIDKKLDRGLSAQEEQELAQVKGRINEVDHRSPGEKRIEAAARAVDQELADIRRFIESHPKKKRV